MGGERASMQTLTIYKLISMPFQVDLANFSRPSAKIPIMENNNCEVH